MLPPAALHEFRQSSALSARSTPCGMRSRHSGRTRSRRWVRLVVTLAAGQNKSSELVLSAMVRARFCELLSPKIKHGESDLFLMGLLSLMDAILEIPMSEVLENVPVDQETKAVLLGGSQPPAAAVPAHAGAGVGRLAGHRGAVPS